MPNILLRGKAAMGQMYLRAGDYESAYELFAEVAEKTERKKDLLFALSAGGIATVFMHTKEYQHALNCFLESLAAYDNLKHNKNNDLAIAITCDNINIVYQKLEDYATALKYAERARSVFEKHNAEQFYGVCYNNLMCLYVRTGEMSKAIEISAAAAKYGKVTDMRRTMGLEKAEIALNIAAMLQLNNTNISETMRMAHEMLGVQERELAENDPVYAQTLTGTGMIYQQLNDYEKALEYALRSLEICVKNHGKNHPVTAEAYINAGDCYVAAGDYEKAINYGHDALDIFLSRLGANNLKTSNAYHFLSSAYSAINETDKAMDYARKALDSARNSDGYNHSSIIGALRLISLLYLEQKKYQMGFSYAEQTLKMDIEEQGMDNPNVKSSYVPVVVMALINQMPQAVKYTKDLMNLLINSPLSILKLPQEHLRFSYLRDLKREIDMCYSVVFTYTQEFDAAFLYDFALKTSNINAEISYAHAQINTGKYPAIKAVMDRASSFREEQAKHILEGNGDKSILDGIAVKIEVAEIELLKHLGDAEIGGNFKDISVCNVQNALREKDIILEFGRYTWYADKQAFENKEFQERYYVFGVTKAEVRIVDIGSSGDIDDMVGVISRDMDLGESQQIRTEVMCTAQLYEAYDKLIGQFDSWLTGLENIYIVPDSNLYTLPFELLADKTGVSLREKANSIRFLSSGREILRNKRGVTANSIQIVANPQYEINQDDYDNDSNCNNPNNLSRDTGKYLRAENITKLPFTEVEAEEIASLFAENAFVSLGAAATENSLVTDDSDTDILHIATHGYAYPSQEDGNDSFDLFGEIERGKRIIAADDPLLRCGLLFSGAVNWLKGESLPDAFGDGILNGREVLSLDLSKYRLLTLSACQTGLGYVQSGEGVKGLRRAFEMAGVETLVCTLWKVDDFASALLMKIFYEELLKAPTEGVSAALSKAKEFVRNINRQHIIDMGWAEHIVKMHGDNPEYAKHLASHEQPLAHPCYWAGFIVQG
ncbi:MAG: CHAT domain-containing protein [Defluviitaleaceae bacterium]|nr:CHAT domain-containing protein [Defluviitaleaceae bacterium]